MTFTQIAGNKPAFLIQGASYPSFSFFFRIHSGSEKQIHDGAHLRNCCHETLKNAGLDVRLLVKLQEKTDQLIEQLDFKSGAKSIGLFISENTAHSDLYYVNLPERQYVSEYFSGYESLYAMQASEPYLLFLLEPATVNVFRGQGTHLKTLSESNSLNHLLSACKQRSPVRADKDGKVHSGHEYDPKWKNELAKALAAVCSSERLSAFVVGLNMAGLDQSNLEEHGVEILGTIKEVHQSSDSERLGSLTEQLLQSADEKNAHKLLELCNTAFGAQKLASGTSEILSCANEGRGEILVLESPGWNTETKVEFSALHMAIRETLVRHGEVEFVPQGTLAQWQGAAMILRY
ncbi:hypothetical protein BH10CYA1_BH10CYA1_36530 [soil metagenome]